MWIKYCHLSLKQSEVEQYFFFTLSELSMSSLNNLLDKG